MTDTVAIPCLGALGGGGGVDTDFRDYVIIDFQHKDIFGSSLVLHLKHLDNYWVSPPSVIFSK